jgi:ABC-type antimicrobial peptide transport system permease subunit
MALGAWPRAIVRLIVGQGLGPVAAGLATGLALALALARSLESQLFGISARDPATYLLGSVLILASAAAVCALPARRASRVDPAVAVRGAD